MFSSSKVSQQNWRKMGDSLQFLPSARVVSGAQWKHQPWSKAEPLKETESAVVHFLSTERGWGGRLIAWVMEMHPFVEYVHTSGCEWDLLELHNTDMRPKTTPLIFKVFRVLRCCLWTNRLALNQVYPIPAYVLWNRDTFCEMSTSIPSAVKSFLSSTKSTGNLFRSRETETSMAQLWTNSP